MIFNLRSKYVSISKLKLSAHLKQPVLRKPRFLKLIMMLTLKTYKVIRETTKMTFVTKVLKVAA